MIAAPAHTFAAYATAAQQHFAAAGPAHAVTLTVGGQVWRLISADTPWAQRYTAVLLHLRTAETAAPPDLTVHIWSGGSLPAPPWAWARQQPHSLHSDFPDDCAAALLYTGMLVLIDRPARQAWVWHPDGDQLPPWDFAAPLRDLIELWFRPTPLIRLHAGAVGTDRGGALLVGRSGSGKSTSTLACLLAGLRYAGDDYVLVDAGAGRIHSLYRSGKLTPDTLDRLPELRAHIQNPDTMTDFKAHFDLGALFPERMAASLPLSAIVLPRITGERASRIVPLAPARALLALAPSTLFQAAEADAADFAKLSQLVRHVPAYTLEAGTDLPGLAATLREHLDHA